MTSVPKTEHELRSQLEGLRVRVAELERSGSDRERATKALHDTNERFRLLVASVQGYAIFMLDCGGHVVSWNQGARKIKGFDEDEIIGRNFSCFYPPEDIQSGRPHRELEAAAAAGSFEDEGWRVRKDGSRLWANVVITALRDEAGELRGFANVTRDITERKQVEEELRGQRDFVHGLIDTAPVIVLVLDTHGRIVRFNSYVEELSGYRSHEVEGKDWFDTFLPQRDRTWIREVFARAVGDVPTRGNANPIVTKDGRELVIEWYSTSLKDSQGNATGVLAIGQDISERIRAETALREGHDDLERRVAERTAELVATVDRLQEEIVERMRVEQTLLASEERLAEAQRVARLGSWEWDVVENTLHWSDELYRLFGLEPGDLAPTHQSFLERVHPEDRDRVNDHVEATVAA